MNIGIFFSSHLRVRTSRAYDELTKRYLFVPSSGVFAACIFYREDPSLME